MSDHALQFRVMRLRAPPLAPTAEAPPPLDVRALLGAGGASGAGGGAQTAADVAFAERAEVLSGNAWALAEEDPEVRSLCLRPPRASRGALCVPPAFGHISLGETFVSLVRVSNGARRAVANVGIKAELSAERGRTTLFDSTAAPLAQLAPGEHYDFLVEADLKELGPHMLACAASYSDSADGERRLLQQHFKFAAGNPLSVRTKLRQVGAGSTGGGGGGATLLEASIECAGREPMFLESVRLAPAAGLRGVQVGAGAGVGTGAGAAGAADADGLPANPTLLMPGGGSRNFLFRLERASAAAEGAGAAATAASPVKVAAAAAAASGASLGKLEIRWSMCMGESGRLQTHQIMGPATPTRDVSLSVAAMASNAVQLEEPFVLEVRVTNHTERAMGAMRVRCVGGGEDEGPAAGVAGAATAPKLSEETVLLLGERSALLAEGLAPRARADVRFILAATACGVQPLPRVELVGLDNLPLDSLPAMDVDVKAKAASGG